MGCPPANGATPTDHSRASLGIIDRGIPRSGRSRATLRTFCGKFLPPATLGSFTQALPPRKRPADTPAPLPAIAAFLEQTAMVVPPGAEGCHIDLDRIVAELMAGSE